MIDGIFHLLFRLFFRACRFRFGLQDGFRFRRRRVFRISRIFVFRFLLFFLSVGSNCRFGFARVMFFTDLCFFVLIIFFVLIVFIVIVLLFCSLLSLRHIFGRRMNSSPDNIVNFVVNIFIGFIDLFQTFRDLFLRIFNLFGKVFNSFIDMGSILVDVFKGGRRGVFLFFFRRARFRYSVVVAIRCIIISRISRIFIFRRRRVFRISRIFIFRWRRVFRISRIFRGRLRVFFIFIFLVIIFATLASNLVPCIINLLKTILNHICYVIRSILSLLRCLVDIVLQVLVELLRIRDDGFVVHGARNRTRRRFLRAHLFSANFRNRLCPRSVSFRPRRARPRRVHLHLRFRRRALHRIQKLLSFARA